MSVNTALLQESLALYHFMCQHIVGTEETVRTKRMMISVRDNLCALNEKFILITSGSFGEGLELEGSDCDLMFVFKEGIVHEDTEKPDLNPVKLNLIMECMETKPGFTLLRCFDWPHNVFLREMCTHNGKSWYMSSEMVKTAFQRKLKFLPSKVHGPCLSDNEDYIDAALCFHNPNWIQPAMNWINRKNSSWPSNDVKSDIIDHGVLLVPVGCKGSDNEALEWRIRFP